MANLRLADVDAEVRNAIAAYTRAPDDGRTDDIVATFCTDVSVDIPGRHDGGTWRFLRRTATFIQGEA